MQFVNMLLPFSKEKETIGFSNQLFAYYNAKDTHGNVVHLYVPAYLRIKTKNIKSLELDELQSEINLTIILSIYWYNLDSMIKQAMKNQISISFRRNNVLLLAKGKNSQLTVDDTEHDCIKFTIRKILKSRVVPYVYFTPLEILDEILTMSFKPIKINNPYSSDKESKIVLHINLMATQFLPNNSNIHVVMGQKGQGKIQHGGYILAEGRMFVQYTLSKLPTSLEDHNKNFYRSQPIEDKNQKQDYVTLTSRPLSFNYAHFHLPIYKQPEVSLLIIYLPLIILAVLNIALFYTQPNLASRLTNLATLMIAFVQLIPIIREEIPPTPHITLTEIIVVMQSVGAIFCLFSSLQNAGHQSVQNIWLDPYFILTFLITLFVFFAPFVMYAYYLIHLKKRHEKEKNGQDMLDFYLFYNYNTRANMYFTKFAKQLEKQQKSNPGIKFISQFTVKQMKQVLRSDEEKEEQNILSKVYQIVYNIAKADKADKDQLDVPSMQVQLKRIRKEKSLEFTKKLKDICSGSTKLI